MFFAMVLAMLFGLGLMVLMWILIAPAKRTIVVGSKERRWVFENRWFGRGPVPLEAAVYILMDSDGQEYRVTKGTYLEAQVGHAITLTQRGENWTSSFADAGESDHKPEGPESA